MKLHRKSLWIVLLLIPLLWVAWPSGKKTATSGDASSAQGQRLPATHDGSQSAGGDGPERIRSAHRPRKDGAILKPAESPEVDRILSDDSISVEQGAVQLRKLAMDRKLPTAERLEALQHGLNLDISAFDGIAEQAYLPAELASHYLHEIINHNDLPATQIKACIALIGHADKEVSELSRKMLGLQLGDEIQSEDDIQKADQEKLIQLGRRKLNELAKDSAQ